MNVATGMNQSNAYRAAFGGDMMPSTVWWSASQLHSKVGHRVEEIRSELAAASTDKHWIASKEELMSYLTRAIRTPLSEIDEHSDLAQEIKVVKTEQGTTRQVKAVNKLGSVTQLCAIAGHTQPPGNNTSITLTQNNLTIAAGLDNAVSDVMEMLTGPVVEMEPVTVPEPAKGRKRKP